MKTMSLVHALFDTARRPSTVSDWGPSLTKQSAMAECDINLIMAEALRTGVLPTSDNPPTYGDVSNIPADRLDAHLLVRDLRARFSLLPDSIQSRFKSPEVFVDFVSDPVNFEEVVSLGLATLTPESQLRVKLATEARVQGVQGAEPPKAPPEPPKAV